MKKEQGIVVGIKGDMAIIRVGRHENCTSCGACAGSQQVTIQAVNSLKAGIGQRVYFTLQEDSVLFSAFVVFILPLFLAALGAFVGWQISGTDKAIAVMAFFFFILSLIMVRIFDRRIAKANRMQPVITEIIC